MDKIVEKAKFIDMYASLPALSFGKDGKVYSRIGQILTFLTIVIIGGMAIWLGISIFGRHKPLIIQYELPPQEWNPRIKWNTDDFKFGLSLLDKDEDAYVSLVTDYLSIAGQIGVGTNECQFDIIPDQTFKCFYQGDFTKDETYLDAKGNWNFVIYYKSCVYSDPDGVGCVSENSTVEYLRENVKATLVYEDLVVDPYNYENPISTIYSDTYAMVLVDVGTTLVIELNEVEFTSDNGWIFEDLKTVKKLKATTSVKISGQAEMLKVQLLYGGKKTVYKRTYPKISDFFAQISGFITIITPIFILLVSPYGNLQAIQHMVNEIFEIKLNKTHDSAGKSLKKPAAAKKKKKSSRHKGNLTAAATEMRTGAGTERNLLSQETIIKFQNRVPVQSKNIPFTPHSALSIGDAIKDDSSPVPEENVAPFRFDSLVKSPSSPLRSTLISPRQDQTKLITSLELVSQKPENGQLNENLEPIEGKEEIENQSLEEDSESEVEEVPLRTSDSLEVPWQNWLKSLWKPNPEVQVLKKAKEHLAEAFDLVTLAKKVMEIDKLKACLLTHEQRVVFENLPSSIIVLNPYLDVESPEAIKQYHWKDSFKGDQVALKKAYSKLKESKTELDKLLLRLYESEYIYDGFTSKTN